MSSIEQAVRCARKTFAQAGIQKRAQPTNFRGTRKRAAAKLEECSLSLGAAAPSNTAGGCKLAYRDGAKKVQFSQPGPPSRHLPGSPLHDEGEWYGCDDVDKMMLVPRHGR